MEHDSDIATMDHDQLVSALLQLRAAVRHHHYTSDCRHLLPEVRDPKPPWPEVEELEEAGED